jgi:hypothetical protein
MAESSEESTVGRREVSPLSVEATAQPATPEAAAAAALDLRVARYMFYGGFALLPWLWFIAWVHFRKVAKQPHADPRLATYVNRSLVGAVCGGVAFVAWVVTIQLSWQHWDFARSIMLVVPEDDEL